MNNARPSNAIHHLLFKLASQLCFNRITILHPEHLPSSGPVLYLGLHRNGAIDGLPYAAAVPNAIFLISAQLHRSWLGRLAFPGIAVARQKDRVRGIGADNGDALDQCAEHLRAGGSLFIMPEGTSSLGPRHFPFRSGAARIAHHVLESGIPLTVVPVAVHYECAWEWQSRIEVVIGSPKLLSPAAQLPLPDLRKRFTRQLEAVGINVATEEELRFIEGLAYAATLGTHLTYADCLKHFEAGVSDSLRQQSAQLRELAEQAGAMTHQGVPLIPIGSPYPYAFAWFVLAPFMAVSYAGNLPPLLTAYIAGRKLPDDLNVVAFWRAAVGLPALSLWLLMVLPTLMTLGGAHYVLAYLGISIAGLRMTYRFRKLTVAVYNAFRAPHLKQPLLEFRTALLKSIGHA